MTTLTMYPAALLAALLLAAPALAREVPDNLQEFYDDVRDKGVCERKLASGFWSTDENDSEFTLHRPSHLTSPPLAQAAFSANIRVAYSYCGDHLYDYKIVYIQGTYGSLANMDIDCDGAQRGPADDGRCGSSNDTQSQTTFRDTIASYKTGIKDLNAYVHPYVVFGNQGAKKGWKTFDPQAVGIHPLSVMAVVCGDRLVYGVWGDTNGDDGQFPMVGEASISLATACFGHRVNGNSGYDDDDVLYIAFVGEDAVPGAKGANWSATDSRAFEKSIEKIGDMLVERISGAGGDDFAGVWLRFVMPLCVALMLAL